MSYDETQGGEIECFVGDGRKISLYSPVGPASCDRCGETANDVEYMVYDKGEPQASGGLCGLCLIAALPAERKAG
ncbi:MAG: hypothetical protein AB7F97_09300 [Solirubrobacterales bacterium]